MAEATEQKFRPVKRYDGKLDQERYRVPTGWLRIFVERGYGKVWTCEESAEAPLEGKLNAVFAGVWKQVVFCRRRTREKEARAQRLAVLAAERAEVERRRLEEERLREVERKRREQLVEEVAAWRIECGVRGVGSVGDGGGGGVGDRTGVRSEMNREPFALKSANFTPPRIGRRIAPEEGTRHMRLRLILAELRHRGVLKVATVYLASGVVVLEVGSHLLHNFEAPHWVVKVFTALVIFGLPVACLMAWGFEFKDGAVHPAPPMNPDAPAQPGRADAFLAGLLLIVLGLLAVLVVQQWRSPVAEVTQAAANTTVSKPGGPATTHISTGPPSIAVLPFVDMSAEHDQQYLGDGIAEELLNALASIEGLKVAARTSSFSFAGKGASIKEIGDTMHVRHVLEGSVRRSGEKLRVTAQLVDVESGFQLFTQSYDREVKDIFEIQNEIAREIVAALLPKLGLQKDANLVKQGTANIDAYNLRLKAHQWLTNPDPKQVNTAIEQLQRAIAFDPNYGDAWGDLSYVYAYSATWARDPIPPMMKASNAASIALVHSPANVPALLTQAYISTLVDRDFLNASTYYEKARAAGVDQSVWAFNRAYFLHGPLGHFDASIAELEEAERRDPLALNVKFALIEIYLAAGQTGNAVATAERMLKLSSTMPGCIAYAANAYLADGNVQRAQQLLAQLRAETDDDFWHVLMLQFRIDAATGRREDARQLLDRLLRENTAGETVSPFVIGVGYRSLGDTQQAIDWWKRAVEQHHPHGGQMTTQFRGDPVISTDPRFLASLKRMGLESDAQEKGAGQ